MCEKSATQQTEGTKAPPLKVLVEEKAGALEPEDSVADAGERLRRHHAENWPVAKNRRLVGMIAEENPDWKIGGKGHDPKDWKVGQIMSRDVDFCFEDQDCAAARQLMKDRDLSFLPVVDRQMKIVGIFSRAEIEERIRDLCNRE